MTVEVHRDPWGVPSVRAGDVLALARAQGRNVAEDRGWQIEVERHRAQGTSAAFLGEEALEWDLFARRARLADTARRCVDRLDPPTLSWLTAYTEGVTEGLAQVGSLAPEFAAAGVRPGRWEPWVPLAVWLSTHVLFSGLPSKLWRDVARRALGPAAVGWFATDGPATAGSNGWLLPGSRTVSHSALLAGDPHRIIEAPGVYQQIHLVCPEFDVVGLAVPGVPGIAHFGHTGSVAWGITNAMADYQDLYRERLRRRGDRVEARGPEGWREATAHTETVEVRGGEPVTVEIVETARGPLVAGGADEGVGVSLRHVPRVEGDLGFSALLPLLRARTVAEVDAAVDAWVEPVNVLMAADTDGGLLHRVAGKVPVRHRDNSSGTVPAWEARYAWEGRFAQPPRAAVPECGAVMANQAGLAAPLGVEFAAPHRAARIRELLDSRERWSARDLAAVHTDTHLGSARTLLALLPPAGDLDATAGAVRERLLRWDRSMAADSADAGLYALLRAAVVRRLTAHPVFAPLAALAAEEGARLPAVFAPWLAFPPRAAFALDTLLTPGAVPGLDPAAEVAGALAEVAGSAAPARPWGESHLLAAWQALPEPAAPRPGLGGDHDCVLSTSGVPGLAEHAWRGPAARWVWDLGDRAESGWVVPFGAHGTPGHPHAYDQLPMWRQGALVPVPSTATRPAGSVGPGPSTAPDEQKESPFMATDSTAADATPVHEEIIEGFGAVTVVPVDPKRDGELIHHWVSQERAAFWGMVGKSREEVEDIYSYLDSLTTHHAFLVLRDREPVALFQAYEPTADVVGACYEVAEGDYGVHLFIAPAEHGRQEGFTGVLLPVFLRFVLKDPSRRRVVVEPDARNEKAVARLVRTGFELGPEIELPDKRARLAFLRRETVTGPF